MYAHVTNGVRQIFKPSVARSARQRFVTPVNVHVILQLAHVYERLVANSADERARARVHFQIVPARKLLLAKDAQVRLLRKVLHLLFLMAIQIEQIAELLLALPTRKHVLGFMGPLHVPF